MSYHQLEEQAFNWLYSRHLENSAFTFSLRRNGIKGSERDYFIGTKKSQYFATTLWKIPVGFPGSSNDLIDVVIKTNNNNLSFYIEFFQTNAPGDAQNESALQLIQIIKEDVKTSIGISNESTDGSKMFTYRTIPQKQSYDTIDSLMPDIEKQIELLLPIVDKGIATVKQANPEFTAHRFTPKEFTALYEGMLKRRKKYLNKEDVNSTNNEFKKIIANIDQEQLNVFFSFLAEIFNYFNLERNDERFVLGIREQQLNFTVGQRYCFNYFLNNSKGKYGVISTQKLLDESEPYDGVPPKPYYNYYQNFKLTMHEKKSILDAIGNELNRTTKSGYLKWKNEDFEEHLWNFIDKQSPLDNRVNSQPLNQVLYGPPGTGKTYNTINKALELCGEDLNGLGRTEIKELFEQKVDEGRIVFTTFHQSMTYEDFVEGIKPIEPEKEGDPVIYRVEEGIFRKLCIEASFSLAKEKESVATETVLDFSLAYDNFVQEVEEKLASEEQVKLTTKNGGKVVVDGISQQGNIIIKHPGKDNTYPVSKQRLSKLHAAFPDLSSVNNIDQQFRAIIGGSNSTANWSVLNEIRNNNSLPRETKKSIRKYTWDEKKEVVQSLKKEDYKGKKGEPYVLIIDEINRGNVSQIFGELITLIEQDKRLGSSEAIQVQLPYSKEWFGVPPNVHIIGTMNTADRSVEALDTALRRRFSFTEMPPVSDLLEPKNMILSLWNSDDFFTVDWDNQAFRKQADDLYRLFGISSEIEERVDGDELEPGFWTKEHLEILDDNVFTGFNLQIILDTLNRRIEKLLDKDHMIGHSYFLTVNNIDGLKRAFQNNIIPLLQEYFFGDYGKIGLIIGSDFFDIVDNHVEDDFFAPFEDYDVSPLVERKVYHLKNILNMDDEDFTNAITNLLGGKS